MSHQNSLETLVAELTPHFAPDVPSSLTDRLKTVLIKYEGSANCDDMVESLLPLSIQKDYLPSWVTSCPGRQRHTEAEGLTPPDTSDELIKWLHECFSRLPEATLKAFLVSARGWALSASDLKESWNLTIEWFVPLFDLRLVREASIAEKVAHHLRLTDLREVCEEFGLKKSGRKAEVTERIVDHVGPETLQSFCPELVEPVYISTLTEQARSTISNYLNWVRDVLELWVGSELGYLWKQRRLRGIKEADRFAAVEIIGGDDLRTCGVCRDMDGQKYPVSNVPELPVHPGCRCTCAYALDFD